jgi:hypothetical protein
VECQICRSGDVKSGPVSNLKESKIDACVWLPSVCIVCMFYVTCLGFICRTVPTGESRDEFTVLKFQTYPVGVNNPIPNLYIKGLVIFVEIIVTWRSAMMSKPLWVVSLH